MLCQAVLISTLVTVDAENKMCFYVDVKASEDGDGTFANPFNNIESVKEKVKNIISKGEYPENGIAVMLREGTYKIDETLTFTSTDSGADNAPVKWCSYDGEEVTITMGDSISFSEFSVARRLDTSRKFIR